MTAHHNIQNEVPDCDDRQWNICKDGRHHVGSKQKCDWFDTHCQKPETPPIQQHDHSPETISKSTLDEDSIIAT